MVGSVVDGVPESIIFAMQLATGLPVSPSFIAAVMVSNVPHAIAPSAELATSGWSNSLIPFSNERGGELAGVAAVFGFCLSLVSG